MLRSNNLDYVFDIDEHENLLFLGSRNRKCDGHESVNSNLTIDLHNLSVKFAKQVVESVIAYVTNSASSTSMIQFIVGVGNHSKSRVSVLGPKLTSYLLNQNYSCELKNGSIILSL